MSPIQQRDINILVPIKHRLQNMCSFVTQTLKDVLSCTYIIHKYCCSVTQLCLTLCDPMDCSTPGVPVPHHLPVCPSSCSLVMLFSHLILWCPLLPFCPQSFQASGSFPMSCQFASHDQNTGASASASVLPVNIQGWSPLKLTSLISLLSKGLLQHHSSKASIIWHSAFFTVQLTQPCMTTGKTIALTI